MSFSLINFTAGFLSKGMVILFKQFCTIEQMATMMPYHKNRILQNQEIYEAESWYIRGQVNK